MLILEALAAILATAAFLYAVVCAAIALRFTRARRVVPNATPAGVQTVALRSRDGRARIDGWFLDAESALGAVVFVHGKDACRGDELKSPTFELANELVRSGLAVLMIDLRGHGHSSNARLTYGAHERFDVLGAVDWLRGRGHARIGVLGASMGAATSLLAAADEPAITAVVADSPFADFGLMIDRQYRRLCRLPMFFLPGALALGRVLTGIDLARVCPLEAAGALVGRAALVIHSERDRFIPAADARAIAARAGAELWVTDSDGHIGSYRNDPKQYTERVVAFLCRHLLGGSALAEITHAVNRQEARMSRNLIPALQAKVRPVSLAAMATVFAIGAPASNAVTPQSGTCHRITYYTGSDRATAAGIGTDCPGLKGRPGRKTRYFKIERLDVVEMESGRRGVRLPAAATRCEYQAGCQAILLSDGVSRRW